MTSKPSVTGGACIIASVCVGAGMLGFMYRTLSGKRINNTV